MELHEEIIVLAGRLDLMSVGTPRPMVERLTLATKLRSLETQIRKTLKELNELKATDREYDEKPE